MNLFYHRSLVKIIFLSLITVSCFYASDAKILILTISYNQPNFIEIQNKTFKKFVEDEYEFVVFNNAIEIDIRRQIQTTCKNHALHCIEVPIKHCSDPSTHHTEALQYALETVGFTWPDIVLIIDSDMWVVKKFNIRQYLKDYDIAGLHQQRGPINYMWPGLVMLDMNTIPNRHQINFRNGTVDGFEGADSGAHMYYYFKNNSEAKVNYIDNVYLNDNDATIYDSCHNVCENCRKNKITACSHNSELLQSMGFDAAAIQFIQKGPHRIEFLINNSFFHYRSGSNYDGKSYDYHQHKTALLNEFMQNIL